VKFEIRNVFGDVIYAADAMSLRDAVKAAVRGGSDLRRSDLSGLDLSGLDLSYSKLSGSNLSYSNLSGSNLSYSNLSYSNLSYSNLSYSNLSGSDMRYSNLSYSNLSYSNLSGSDMRGSDMRGSDMRGSDLSGSKLSGSKLSGSTLSEYGILVGNSPILQIGPIGSRNDYLIAYTVSAGVCVRTGCFFGSLEEFRVAVETTHGSDTTHGREYAAAIAMIEAHAAIWTPAQPKTEAI
jgi:hypothetical protein